MYVIGMKRKDEYIRYLFERIEFKSIFSTEVDDDLDKIINTWPELILDINRKI